jgi:ATP dependent DNA ligase C terminal region
MNGPGAEEILRSAVSPSVSPFPSPGSLIGLDCMERKKLLYRLVEVQPKKVEIVDTHVIRPNGGDVPGVKYFKRESEEYGYPMFTVDSIACCIRGEVSDLSTIDAKRRGMRSDDEISQTRARAVNAIYIHYVEKRREEGLIFKDLSTFYVPGEHHRSKRYWLKFKPDYFNGSSASDIDLVIVGAYFASGLRSAGQPSSFLCACVDASGGEQKFLPITKVNARSLKDDDYQRILNHTGYSFTLERVSFGKWDPDRDSVAPTVSYEVTNGKKDIPDLWICPENSVVVTLNAGEIVSSDSFPAGLTLRFPRITRLRMDGDAKEPHDIESNDQLWQRFEEVTAQRRAVESLNAMSFKSNSDSPYGCRFLTESQELRQKKQARTVDRLHYQPLVPSVAAEARLLVGRRFAVLNGRYSLHKDEIEVALSKSEGWYDDAARVESQGDVQAFIKRHGGVVRLAPINDCCVLGGMWNDGRVLAHGKEGFGILRWTYVYREVTRLKAAVAEGHNKETLFQIREPTLLDFLVLKRETDAHVLSRNADSKGDCAPRRIARECKIMDRLDLMMALRCVGQDRLSRSIIEKSREHGVYGAPSSSWDAEALRDTVWPMRRCLWPVGQNNCPVDLFPDIFRDDFELSEDLGPKNRLNEADSSRHTNHIHRSIPLAQSMGARVTYHLHSRTTHVLCDISGSREWTVWNQETNYASLGIRKSLSECLLRVCRERQIILLSPKYLSKVFSSGSS